MRNAAESNLKEATLEMGGKDPAVVLYEAENIDRVAPHVADVAFWNIGDPLDLVSQLGVLASHAQFKNAASYQGKGAKVLIGSKTGKGFVVSAIINMADRNATRACEGVFGPVLAVLAVASFDDAIALANVTEHGLTASILTANAKCALRIALAIRPGTVTFNSFGEGDISAHLGGYKSSGFGGRSNCIHAYGQYTQFMTKWTDLADHGGQAAA